MTVARTPLPVTVIGGYLGAGKTTLVNHLLRERDGVRIAVLVNDFGELSIDDDLIESTEGGVLRLAGGCVCCSFGNDLVGALLSLPAMEPPPEHILIEASGVALPGSVARTLSLLPLLQLDAIVVLADALSLRARAADAYVGDTVRQQLRDADLLVLNKIDLVSQPDLVVLEAWLQGMTAGARVLRAEHSRLPVDVVLGTGAAAQRTMGERPSALLQGPLPLARPPSAVHLFESVGFQFDHAVDCHYLGRELARDDLGLVRAKGLMRDADGEARSLQVVGSRCDVRASAHRRPGEGRLVCIAPRGRLDRERIGGILAAAARKTIDSD